MSDPEEIYLAPKCCLDPEMGRCWAADDEWPIEPGDENNGHEPATRYVRADLAHAELMKLREEIARLHTELNATIGYMLNAQIDLETGATKATAVTTIKGGIKRARAALPKTEADHD